MANTFNPTMALTPSPVRGPKPQHKPTPAELALRQQMNAAQRVRPEWVNSNPTVKRLQRTLAKNPALRNAVFALYNKSGTQFLTKTPQEMLLLTRQVAAHLEALAIQQVNLANQVKNDPNDVTNTNNQANPNNMTSQALAANAAATEAQNNIEMQNVLTQDNQQAETTEHASHTIGAVAAASGVGFELAEADIKEIAEHNKKFNPTPKPGGRSEEDDEEKENKHDHGEVKKLGEHEGERKGAEFLAKNGEAKENALDAVIKNDKSSFMEAAEGLKKQVAKVAVTVGKAMIAGG